MRDVLEICGVIFGLGVMLFHLANAALLPLVGQELAAAFPEEAISVQHQAAPLTADRNPSRFHAPPAYRARQGYCAI
jgi:hypothetical protein